MCVIMETTVTGSGGFHSQFLSFCRTLVRVPEQSIRVISLRFYLLNQTSSLRQVRSSFDTAVHDALTRATDSLRQP